MMPYRGRMLALLLSANHPFGCLGRRGVSVRFKLLEPTRQATAVRSGGYIHVEPWRLPTTVFASPDGVCATPI